jgi:hypothetical protein
MRIAGAVTSMLDDKDAELDDEEEAEADKHGKSETPGLAPTITVAVAAAAIVVVVVVAVIAAAAAAGDESTASSEPSDGTWGPNATGGSVIGRGGGVGAGAVDA